MKKKTKIVLLGVLIFALLAASGLGITFMLKKAPSGSGNVLDVAWYDEDGTEFTIDTADELYELAALSQHYNFKGQTIKLGADIVVNEGNAEDWELKNPERLWEPINGFAGTFDGQGHTISGICGKAYRYAVIDKELVYYPTGMFTNTQAKCVIKDFRLVNSYFCSDLNEGVGSVASNGGGTFDSIYSNAIIVSYKSNNGGIVGMLDAKGSHKVTNCWFDGEIRVEGNVGRYNGGIVGRVLETGGQSKIEHCLNTGKLSSTVTGKGVNMGGILGNVAPKARANLKDCLAVGFVENEYAIAVGAVLGCVEGEATLNIADCYGSADSFKTAVGNVLGTSHGAALRFSRAMLTGVGGYQWTSLDFDEYWTVVEDSTPILQYFADEIPSLKGVEKKYNLDWYSRSKKEFVLKDAKDLYGFAMMSYSTDFEDKTIKLGADIVVNEGNAKDWAANAPEYEWLQIGQVNLPFAGTFDGDMHSISGIYLSAKENCSGLFSTTANTATLKNFKLTNSYFESDALNFASIVGRGRGTFDTIYSDAIVVSSKANLGGFIGQIPSDYGVTMTNCWFNGSVTSTGNATSDRRTGGLIGFALADTTLNNCLNTGVVDASAYCAPNSATSKVIAPLVGGLAGSVAVDKVLTFNNCLNTGEIKYSKVATAGYGAVIGWSQGTAVMNQTYATRESCVYPAGGTLKGQVIAIDEENIKGYKAYQWTVLDFNKYWAVVKSGTPILKSFATDIPSLAGIKRMIDISWYNADKKVYTLNSKEDLHGLALLSYSTDFAKKTIKLTADITVNEGNAADWATKAPECKWTPIGTSSQPFAGTFDGGMHTISGLYLKADENYGGLFGSTASTAIIKNVKLTNSYMETSAQSFGSIAGRGRGTFDTIYSNAIVVGSTCNLGGFVGQVPADGGVTMNNCWFDGSVTSKGNTLSDRRTGGFVGFILSDSSLNNCLNTGTVDVTAYTCPNTGGKKVVVPMAGGLVGSVAQTYTLQIKNSLNVGQIKTSEAATAGYGSIIGWSDGTTVISETHASADSCDMHANGTYTGQVGVVNKENLTGHRAYQWTLLDFNKYWAVVTDSTPIPQPFATEIPSLAGIQRMLDISWVNEAKGTKNDPYILSDAADLYGLAMLTSDAGYKGFKDKYIKLSNDIVINSGTDNAGTWATNAPEYNWTPIGSKSIPFAGNFDGDMHTISGIYLNASTENSGLFGVTHAQSTIQQLKIENSYFTSEAYGVGSVVGQGRGAVSKVYSDAIVVGSKAFVGGLVGYGYGENILLTECWYEGTVTNTSNIASDRGTGGLIGSLYSNASARIEDCLYSGVVDATASKQEITKAGGFVGSCESGSTLQITDALNAGAVDVAYGKFDGVIVGCINGAKVKCTTSYGYGVKGEDFIAGYVQSGGEFLIDYIYNGVLTENDNRSKNQSTTNKENRYRNIPIMFINRNNPATYAYKGAETTMAGFDYDETWTLLPYGAPVLTCFADRVINTEWPGDAKGNEEHPYIISDVKDLYAFVILSQKDNFNKKTIKLVDDIVLNIGNAKDWDGDTPEYAWTPIGKFAGTFNGDNHTISGLYMNATASNSGMFAETLASSTICNLYLKNSYLKSSNTGLGSIVGAGRGRLSKVYSDAIVNGAKQRIGGLIGGAFDKSNVLSECWFAGTVTNTGTTSNDRGTGGLIGMLYGSAEAQISDCLLTGIVDATKTNETVPKIGGLVGSVEKKAVLTITDCLNAGDVRVAAGKWDGVMIGCIDGADVRCTTSYGFGVGGTDYIVGWMQNSGKFIIDYYHAGTLYENVDRSANSASSTSVNNSHRKIPIMFLDRNNPTSYTWNSATTALAQFDFDNKWSAVPSGVAVPKHFEKEVLDTSWYQEAKGTEEDPYVLSDLADLYGFAFLSKTNTFEGKTVQLANDIAINKGNVDAEDWANNAPIYIWSPISEFYGTFDGNGKNVSGLYINSTSDNTGFFARTAATSTVKNLWITNSYIKSTAKRVGSVAGISLGTFDTIYSNAIIDVEKDNVGGIGGYVHVGTDTLFKNCWFNGQINGKAQNAYYFGGILGNIETAVTETVVTMENCLNTGLITSIRTKAAVVGGLCGSAYHAGSKLIVKDSLFTGYFDCANMDTVATVVGYVPNGTVELTDVYSVSGTIPAIGVNGAVNNGIVKGEATLVSRDNLKGDKAQTNASGLDYQNIWLAAEGKTPVLQAFKNYASEGVTGMLLGNSISKYRIIIDANASTLTKMLASYFQDMIKSETGATLPIVTDANAATGYEIVMGDTTRAISDLLYVAGEYTNADYGYTIKNSDKSIVIGYSDATALVAAWKKFVVLLNEDTIDGIDVTGTDERVTNVTKANSSDIRVMSSNIYFKDATDFDELGMPWEARAEIMAQVYKVYKPDFIGLQEADAKQHSEILKYIDDIYGIVTFDEASKNMTPLLYRKDLYDVEDKYYHDFGSNRHFEWALYSSKTNPDEKFIHMNLHYSPNKNEQNEHAVFVNLQIKRVMELYPNVPIAVTGDYNNSALSDTYKTMIEGINMASGAALVGNKDSEYYTCHSLGQEKLTTSSSDGTVGPIDIISITTDLLEAKNYKMNHLPITCWGSDHYPVFLDVSRK